MPFIFARVDVNFWLSSITRTSRLLDLSQCFMPCGTRAQSSKVTVSKVNCQVLPCDTTTDSIQMPILSSSLRWTKSMPMPRVSYPAVTALPVNKQYLHTINYTDPHPKIKPLRAPSNLPLPALNAPKPPTLSIQFSTSSSTSHLLLFLHQHPHPPTHRLLARPPMGKPVN